MFLFTYFGDENSLFSMLEFLCRTSKKRDLSGGNDSSLYLTSIRRFRFENVQKGCKVTIAPSPLADYQGSRATRVTLKGRRPRLFC